MQMFVAERDFFFLFSFRTPDNSVCVNNKLLIRCTRTIRFRARARVIAEHAAGRYVRFSDTSISIFNKNIKYFILYLKNFKFLNKIKYFNSERRLYGQRNISHSYTRYRLDSARSEPKKKNQMYFFYFYFYCVRTFRLWVEVFPDRCHSPYSFPRDKCLFGWYSSTRSFLIDFLNVVLYET